MSLLATINANVQHLEVTAGAFWKALPATVGYEATIPLIYESSWFEKEEVDKINFESFCSNKSDGKPECSFLHNLDLLNNAYELEVLSLIILLFIMMFPLVLYAAHWYYLLHTFWLNISFIGAIALKNLE